MKDRALDFFHGDQEVTINGVRLLCYPTATVFVLIDETHCKHEHGRIEYNRRGYRWIVIWRVLDRNPNVVRDAA